MDLRETLQAAMDGKLEEAAAVETPPAGASVANEAQAAGGGETVAAEAAAEPPKNEGQASGAPERDESGRFKAKTDNASQEAAQTAAAPLAEQTQSEPAKPVEEEPPKEAIRIPPSLPAALKAKFGTLDPDVQQAFVTIEETVQKSKAEWGKKGERLNRYDEIIGPHADRWRTVGLDEFSGIQSLIAAQNMLDRNPIDGILQLARSYGLTPAHLAQAIGMPQASAPQPGAEGYAPTSVPDLKAALQPVLDPVIQQVQTLQQQWQQTQQANEAAELARLTAQVEAFASDPKNLYFHDVQNDVAEIIGAAKTRGQEMTLAEAYERAIWANPTIRPLLVNQQAQAAAADEAKKAEEARRAAEQAARAKSQAAQQAAGSVTGAPTPGAQAPAGPQGSVRDSLRAAMQEHSAL